MSCVGCWRLVYCAMITQDLSRILVDPHIILTRLMITTLSILEFGCMKNILCQKELSLRLISCKVLTLMNLFGVFLVYLIQEITNLILLVLMPQINSIINPYIKAILCIASPKQNRG